MGCGKSTAVSFERVEQIIDVVELTAEDSVDTGSVRETLKKNGSAIVTFCLLYTSPSPRDS